MEEEKKRKRKEKKASSFASSVQSTVFDLSKHCRLRSKAHYPPPKKIFATRLTSWDMNIAWLLSSPLFHGLIETW